MHEIAKRIKEQRLIEATNKGYTGLDGKIGVILKGMGEPIIAHEGASDEGFSFASTPMYDPYALEDEDEIPEYDEDKPRQIGWIFDGLRRGVNMEIKYMVDTKELTLTYEGYLCYAEEAGDLVCYYPHKVWEEKLNQLFVMARPLANDKHKKMAQEEIKEDKHNKLSFLEKLRLRWGKF